MHVILVDASVSRVGSERGPISRGTETLAVLNAGSDSFKYMLFVARFLAGVRACVAH